MVSPCKERQKRKKYIEIFLSLTNLEGGTFSKNEDDEIDEKISEKHIHIAKKLS